MSNCLVTTLKESVTDNSLMKLGEMRLTFGPLTNVSNLIFNMNANTTLTIEGDSYWTDATGTQNYGKVKTSEANNFFAPHSDDISILIGNKYNITNISAGWLNIICDLSEFDYVPLIAFFIITGDIRGSLEAFVDKHDQPITQFAFGGTNKITGDISCLSKYKDSIDYLVLIGLSEIYGDISVLSDFSILQYLDVQSSSKITGNVSSLPSSITSVTVASTSVTGTLASIATRCPNVQVIAVDGTSISGDTSDLAGLAHLTTFSYANCPNITGTWPLT